jgi:hypothetical protein
VPCGRVSQTRAVLHIHDTERNRPNRQGRLRESDGHCRAMRGRQSAASQPRARASVRTRTERKPPVINHLHARLPGPSDRVAPPRHEPVHRAASRSRQARPPACCLYSVSHQVRRARVKWRNCALQSMPRGRARSCPRAKQLPARPDRTGCSRPFRKTNGRDCSRI